MFSLEIEGLARKVIDTFTQKKKKIVTAESCTGGLIAAILTTVPGSSAVLERGFISYSNEAKVDLLGVPPDMIDMKGAVSAEVATAMAQGALEYSLADVAVSVTGIAGPGGGTPEKPVGLVYFGLATKDGVAMHYKCEFTGDRRSIRAQSVHEALRLLLSLDDKDIKF